MGEVLMARWGKAAMRWKKHGFDPFGPDVLEFFQIKLGNSMAQSPYPELSSYFTPNRMREDKSQAETAASFYANLGILVNEYLKRDGNLDDAFEILASHISERAFCKLAKQKYGLRDPLE
jgi:hypothetical protein